MDSALQDYLNRLQNYEGLKTEIDSKMQLKQEKISQITGALESLGLPAGLEAVQSLKDYAIKKGKSILPSQDDLTPNGEGGDIFSSVGDAFTKLANGGSISDLSKTLGQQAVNRLGGAEEQGGNLLKTALGKAQGLASGAEEQGGNLLKTALGKAQGLASGAEEQGGNLLKTALGKAQGLASGVEGDMGTILQRQFASKLPLKQATSKLESLSKQAQDLQGKIQGKVQQIRDGDLLNPEIRQGSLTALSRGDLNSRLPLGGNFESEISGLNGEARSQYIRVLEGDPTEMGSLLPEHLFDHAQFMSQEYRNLGVINPEELIPSAKKAMSDAFEGMPRILQRGSSRVAKAASESSLDRQPATTSDRIGDLLKNSLKEKMQQTQSVPESPATSTESQRIDSRMPSQEVQEGTQPTELTSIQEGKSPADTGLNGKPNEVSLEGGEVAGEDIGSNLAKNAGDIAGEAAGELAGEIGGSVVADALGPVGALVGLGTLIASLVESFKKEQMPNIPQPVLQAGTD